MTSPAGFCRLCHLFYRFFFGGRSSSLGHFFSNLRCLLGASGTSSVTSASVPPRQPQVPLRLPRALPPRPPVLLLLPAPSRLRRPLLALVGYLAGPPWPQSYAPKMIKTTTIITIHTFFIQVHLLLCYVIACYIQQGFIPLCIQYF